MWHYTPLREKMACANLKMNVTINRVTNVCVVLSQQNCSIKNANRPTDPDAFDIREIKTARQSLYFLTFFILQS